MKPILAALCVWALSMTLVAIGGFDMSSFPHFLAGVVCGFGGVVVAAIQIRSESVDD